MTARMTRPAEYNACPPGAGWAQSALRLLHAGVFLLGVGFSSASMAQPVAPAQPAAAPGKTTVAQASVSGPGWTELSSAQRAILQPLAPSWNALSQGHKSKWLQMTKSYPALSAEEQVKMQGRMKEWVALSPQQRAQARLNFAKTKELAKELSAEEKQAKWQAYQSLSDEEKRKLAAKAPARPAGAAPAAKPVSRQKLAAVPSPADKQKGKPAPKIAVSQSMDGPPGKAAATVPAAASAVAPDPQPQ